MAKKFATHKVKKKINRLYEEEPRDSRKLGRVLRRVKEENSLTFCKWVDENCPFGQTQKCKFLRVADTFRRKTDAENFTEKALFRMTETKFPKKVRRQIIKDARQGHIWSEEKILKVELVKKAAGKRQG
jgi:hypothetical protein